jgi:hypothetical protein
MWNDITKRLEVFGDTPADARPFKPRQLECNGVPHYMSPFDKRRICKRLREFLGELMSSETPSPQRSGGPRSWKYGGRELIVGVAAALIATVALSIFTLTSTAFSKINIGSGTAFRIMLVCAGLGIFIAATTLSMVIVRSRNLGLISQAVLDQVHAVESNVLARLNSLESSIPSIDWSYDSAEHDRGVYERMRKVVENPHTQEFKIVTIFRDPRPEEVSESQHESIRRYYQAIENALAQRRGFVYERVVVMRGPLGPQVPAQKLFTTLMLSRPDLMQHCRNVLKLVGHAVNTRVEIKFYGDTGRLVDVAFAIALNDRRKPLTLVLEIGTTGPGDHQNKSPHPALGLLALENPSPPLADAFLLAHQALRSGDTEVEHIPDEAAWEILRGVREA